jgi:hypothetical protein
MTISGGLEIMPLKLVPQGDCNYSLCMCNQMKCLCNANANAIDDVVKQDGSESPEALSKKYTDSIENLKGKEVLLPPKTDAGKKHTRQSEHSWCYYGQQYEENIIWNKKAEKIQALSK